MGAIDADAHVIETVQTWSYLDDEERRFTPQLMTQSFGAEVRSNEGIPVRDFWVIEGRAHGKDRNVGTNTSQESREMLSVESRLAHMDELGIETQVLYPTLFLRPVVEQAERERALCKSYNRWMGDLWRQGKSRLRWVAKPPLQFFEQAPAVVREELEWAKNNGVCGIFMRGLECERALGAPIENIVRLGIPNSGSVEPRDPAAWLRVMSSISPADNGKRNVSPFSNVAPGIAANFSCAYSQLAAIAFAGP